MNNILVSVLLPTRKRTQLVHRSVQSLLSLSSCAANVEIIVAYDDDDLESQSYFQSSSWSKFVGSYGAEFQVIKCPRWGYQKLNQYYTTMARRARGKWFFIWNDDTMMLSQGWDQEIAANSDFVGMLHMTTENFKPSLTLFPLIPRVWLELFKEISLHQLNDSWIQDICHEANAVKQLNSRLFHDRFDVTGNNLDETFQNRVYGKKLYNHESMRMIRSQWAQKLKQYREQIVAYDSTLPQT